MKKLLTIAAVLLTAALVFTGCSNPASGGGEGGPSLPGNWKTTANYNSGTYTIFNTGSLSLDGKGGAIYTNATPTETGTGTNVLTANTFRTSCYKLVSDLNFTGFEGTVSCTSAYSTYGYCFNVSSDFKSYYEVVIQGHGVLIRQYINSAKTILVDWENYSFIKAEPSENTVTVYKDGNSIVIQINGSTVYTISNPELTMGAIACTCGLSYDDIQHQTNIKTTYKLSKFQY